MALHLQQWLSPRFRILAHLVFWLVYMVYFTLLYASFSDNYLRGFWEVLVTLPVKVAATYFTLYVLIPQFLDRRRYLELIVLFLFSAIGFGYLDRLMMHTFYVPYYIPNYNYERFPLTDLSKALQRTSAVYVVVLAAMAVKLIKRNYQNERLAQELHQQKLDAELKLLKGQIHPHFLFNTLNSLYALALQNSAQTSEVVLKLSNLLDYMLYDCNVDQIALRKEIQQMQNLIDLEQLRYGKRLEVNFTSSGDIANRQIPPLLMLPFVENAFKHGVSQDSEDAFINIDLTIKAQQLVLRIENSKAPSPAILPESRMAKGIGLKNVKRRLELLFGTNYDLQIFDEEDTFMAVLKIPLVEVEQASPALQEQPV